MAGLTKAELAGKTAYLSSSDPSPEKPWVDLTPEERAGWIEKGANPPLTLDPASGEVKQITEAEAAAIEAADAPGKPADGAVVPNAEAPTDSTEVVQPASPIEKQTPSPPEESTTGDILGNGAETSADGTASPPPAPAAPSAGTLSANDSGPEAESAPAEKEPMPGTDPEHGDLTPVFVEWFARNHSKAEFLAKYGTRLDYLPADIRAKLEGGAE